MTPQAETSIEDRADTYFWRACDLMAESPREALSNARMALEWEPHHLQALILSGELHLFHSDALGLDPKEADTEALHFFEHALKREPHHAEGWSCLALALHYLGRDLEAMAAAGEGLKVLPERVGYAMDSSDVYENVAATLYSVRVRVLLELGCRDEARSVLMEGLDVCPRGGLLGQLLEVFVTAPEEGPAE